MKIHPRIFLLSLCCILWSCHADDNESAQGIAYSVPALDYAPLPQAEVPSPPKYKWKKRGEKVFQTPDLLSFSNRGCQYREIRQGARLICNYNFLDVKRIIIYDWESEKLLHDIKLASEGPNKLRNTYSLSYDDPDRIWTHNSDYFRFHQIDSQGKIIDQIDLTKIDIPVTILQASAYSWKGNPIHTNDTAIYFLWNTGNYSNAEVKYSQAFINENDRPFGYINFDRPSQARDLPIAFLKEYLEKKWVYSNDVDARWSWLDENTLYYSFPISEKVMSYKLGKDKIIQRRIKSAYLPPTLSPLKLYDNRDDFEIVMERGFYGSIYTNPWQGLVYRLIIRPGTEPYDSEGTYTQPRDYSYAIQVMDTSLNYLGEFTLAEKSFETVEAFVSPEGLWFPLHPETEGIQEN